MLSAVALAAAAAAARMHMRAFWAVRWLSLIICIVALSLAATAAKGLGDAPLRAALEGWALSMAALIVVVEPIAVLVGGLFTDMWRA